MLQSPAFFRFSLLLVCLGIAINSYCWGLTGHRVVGQIAQNHLSKKAKNEIKKLIGRESLAWWSNWADFIKSDTSFRSASPWHYVDLPGHMEKSDFIAQLKLLPGKNLYTQIIDLKKELADKSLPLEQRQRALYWLVHLVGDLHQPLHVGRDEDQGGNKIVVYWFDKKTNLHTLWDSMLIEFQQYSYTEYGGELDIRSAGEVALWQSGSLEDWFFESHEVSDRIYDGTPAESKLSYNYNFQFKKTLEEQLLKGGLRLAKLLNEAFD